MTDLNSINYIYNLELTSGTEIAPSNPANPTDPAQQITLQDVYNTFNDLFKAGGTYEKILSNLINDCNSLLGKNFLSLDKIQNLTKEEIQNAFLNLMNVSSNKPYGNCLSQEGLNAYSYYVERITTKILQLASLIERAQQELVNFENLSKQTDITILNNLANINITNLYLYDKYCHQLHQDFTRRYKCDSSNNLYEDFSDSYIDTSKITKAVNEKSKTFDALNTITENGEKTTLKVFSQLNLCDKLRYIKTYYNSVTETKTLYPDDAQIGFPCTKSPINYAPDADSQEYGSFEIFYLGFIIDRDNPINALASLLELKVTAINASIQQYMKRTRTLKQALMLYNNGLQQLTNCLDAKNQGTVPDSTRILAGVLGKQKFIKNTVKINGSEYFVFMPDAITSNYTAPDNQKYQYNISNNGRYILVKATDEGIAQFIGSIKTGANQYNGLTYDFFANLTKASMTGKTFTVDEASSDPIFQDRSLYSSVYMNKGNPPYMSYYDTNINGKLSWLGENNLLLNSKLIAIYDSEKNYFSFPTTPSSATKNAIRNTFSKTYNAGTDGNILFLYLNQTDAIKFLPKDISVGSVSSYGPNESLTIGKNETGKYSTWSTSLSTKADYINTAIQNISTDISTSRKKTDTFNTASNNYRNRAYDTYHTIIGNI